MSRELNAWAIEALDLGFERVNDGDQAPFVFLLDDSDQQHVVELSNITGAIDELLLDLGREVIREFDTGKMYGLVYDGYVTTDSDKCEAIFAEVGSQKEADAFVVAQLYKRKPRSKKLEKVAGPVIAATAVHLWKKQPPKRKLKKSR